MENTPEIVYNFSRQNAQNAEHVQYAKLLLGEVPEEIANKFGFSVLRSNFALSVNNEVAGFKPERAFVDTETVHAVDEARDDAYLLYKKIVQAYANHAPETEKREAARKLAFIFKEAGSNVQRMSYDSESAILDDIVMKFRKEPYTTAITTLGLDEMPDKIEEANENFKTIYRQRMRIEREKIEAADMRSLREATDNAFNVLAKAINSLYMVNEIVDKNEETRTELTELINNVNDVVYRFRKVIGVGNSSQGNGSNGGSSDSDKPQITAVYQKENGNPDKPLDIKRGAVTVIEGNGLTLLNKEGTAAGDLIIRPNWYDNPLDEKVKPDSILVNTDTRIEFNMVPDLAEGKYTLHIETYYNGKDNPPLSEPVVIDFDKEITLI